jgi:hypothetical protein
MHAVNNVDEGNNRRENSYSTGTSSFGQWEVPVAVHVSVVSVNEKGSKEQTKKKSWLARG